MRRMMLILAMVVSLWPAAFIVVSIANGKESSGGRETQTGTSSETQTETSSETQAGTSSETVATAKAQLNELEQEQVSLQHESHASPALRGTADPHLTAAARALATRWSTWSSEYGSLEPASGHWATLLVTLDTDLAQLGERPTNASIAAVNADVTALNEANHGG